MNNDFKRLLKLFSATIAARKRIFMALVFTSLSATAQIADPAFQRCMKSNEQGSMGTTRCYGGYLQRLEKEQQAMVAVIRKALERPAPEGANYGAASVNLTKSQAAWSSFVDADCALGDDVFGLGNAAATAALDCRVKHYEIRNKQLKALNNNHLAR